MTDCLFCKIVSHEIPSDIVYEDDDVIAILDIHPVKPGHVLIIPKQHFQDFSCADISTLEHCMKVIQRVGRSFMKSLRAEGFNVIQNTGEAAGQVIMHLHFHIIPRKSGDGLKHWKGADSSSEDERREILQAIVDGVVN